MLNKRQLQFIKHEFNLSKEQINNLTDSEYKDLWGKIVEIEALENVKCDGKPLSERGELAAEIADSMYY